MIYQQPRTPNSERDLSYKGEDPGEEEDRVLETVEVGLPGAGRLAGTKLESNEQVGVVPVENADPAQARQRLEANLGSGEGTEQEIKDTLALIAEFIIAGEAGQKILKTEDESALSGDKFMIGKENADQVKVKLGQLGYECIDIPHLGFRAEKKPITLVFEFGKEK